MRGLAGTGIKPSCPAAVPTLVTRSGGTHPLTHKQTHRREAAAHAQETNGASSSPLLSSSPGRRGESGGTGAEAVTPPTPSTGLVSSPPIPPPPASPSPSLSSAPPWPFDLALSVSPAGAVMFGDRETCMTSSAALSRRRRRLECWLLTGLRPRFSCPCGVDRVNLADARVSFLRVSSGGCQCTR